jgi:hypothetical protein
MTPKVLRRSPCDALGSIIFQPSVHCLAPANQSDFARTATANSLRMKKFLTTEAVSTLAQREAWRDNSFRQTSCTITWTEMNTR